MAIPDPIPAATLVLMRPGPAAPEILMIERGAKMAFAPGALVFPGGRIDPDDYKLGGDLAGAAKVAAIRETLEETGIAVALDPAPDDAMEADMRAALHAATPFSALLEEHGCTLRLDRLVPFARWCPTFRETRNFDTHFFLARAPEGRHPVADDTESVHALWTTAADVLASEAHIIFPTRRNLERLAGFATYERAVADAMRHEVETIIPRLEERNGAGWLCIPENRGYPVTAEPMAKVRRG